MIPSPAKLDSAASSRTFASRHHPADALPTFVFARAVTGPLVFGMLLIMIAAGAAMLLGNDPVWWVVWAAPLAFVVAAAFAVHVMRSQPAEIRLLGDRAAVRSVWDVATRRPAVYERMIPPRRVRGGIDLGVGRDVLTLTAEDWPDLAEMESALAQAVPPVRDDTW